MAFSLLSSGSDDIIYTLSHFIVNFIESHDLAVAAGDTRHRSSCCSFTAYLFTVSYHGKARAAKRKLRSMRLIYGQLISRSKALRSFSGVIANRQFALLSVSPRIRGWSFLYHLIIFACGCLASLVWPGFIWLWILPASQMHYMIYLFSSCRILV